VSTVARLYANGCFINKFHYFNISYEKPRWSGALSLGTLRAPAIRLRRIARGLGPLLRSVNDAYKLPVLWTFPLELHKAVFLGEQCVIAAKADISACVDTCATLPNNDIPSNNLLAAEDFDA